MSDPKTDFKDPAPLQDRIAIRAYELYLERGCQDGHDVEDWLAAETELMGLPVKPAREPIQPEAKRAAATR
ncbi:MAG: DUF2934 domain-containing protein [Candidatus Acidiferrales bacterium]